MALIDRNDRAEVERAYRGHKHADREANRLHLVGVYARDIPQIREIAAKRRLTVAGLVGAMVNRALAEGGWQ